MSGTYLSKIPVLVVALVIGIVLVTSAVVPLASDYSDAKTFKNEGYYNLAYTEVDDVTLVWDYTKPTIFTINDTEITMPDFTLPGNVNIICGDDWFLRWAGNGVQFYSSSNGSITATVGDSTSLSLVASNGSVTITNTASTPVTQTHTYTFMYVLDPNGDYVMKDANEPAYLNGDSEIYAIGRSSTTGLVIKLKITGTIDDGFTPAAIGTSSAVLGDVTANYVKDNNYKDLYKLTSLLVPMTYGEDDSEFTATYSYFIVPAEVTADPDNPAAYKNLVKVVPLMAFIMLVVAAAGMVYLKNKD